MRSRLLARLLATLPFVFAARLALAQNASSLPSEDFSFSKTVPAGPYSVVNTGTCSLCTTIPLVHLTGPGGTSFDFTLYHTSAGALYSNAGQVARGWRHNWDDFIYSAQAPNLSTSAQRNSPAWGLQEWGGSPLTRKPGVREDITPDPNGFYFTVKHKDQSTATYSYKKGGYPSAYYLVSGSDPHNNGFAVNYDANGCVSTVTDSATGRTLTFTWNSQNAPFALASIQLNSGGTTRTWTFATDNNQQLTRITFPPVVQNGAQPYIQFVNDNAGRITDLYDLNNNHWHYDYYTPLGGSTVIWKVTDPNSAVTTYSQNLAGSTSTTTITDPASNQSVHTYVHDTTMASTPTYLISKVQDPPVNGTTYSATYNWNTADGTLTSYTDRDNGTWRYTWDTNNYGDLITEQSPVMYSAGKQVQNTYTAQHKLYTHTDSEGRLTKYYYYSGTWDLQEEQVDPSGLNIVTTYGYYNNGNLQSKQIGGDPAATWNSYDSYGNATNWSDPAGNTWTANFDNLNNKLFETTPVYDGVHTSTTNFGYDLWNRLITETHPDSTSVNYGWDNMSNKVSVQDENGNLTYSDFDNMNRVVRTRQQVSGNNYIVTQFHYNNVGDRDTATSPNNNVTRYYYDPRHHLTQILYPDTTSRSFDYDGNGNRSSRIDGSNNRTNYSYDADNRLIKTQYPSGSISETYLTDGLRSSMTDSTGMSSWGYNGAGLVTGYYQPLSNQTVTYTYQAGTGRKQTATLSTGQQWVYSWDSDGRPYQLTMPGGGWGQWAYWECGLPYAITRANNSHALYGYDSRLRLLNIHQENLVSGTWNAVQRIQYSYDNASNVTGIQDDNWPENITFNQYFYYDQANRLIEEHRIGTGISGYDYDIRSILDGDGNLASTSFNYGAYQNLNYDGNDKFSSGVGYTFSYQNTGDGNPTMLTLPSGAQMSLSYDYEYRPTQISYSNSTPTSYFIYDGDGHRVKKQDSQGATYYVLDLDGTVLAEEQQGQITKCYGPGVGFYIPSTGATYYDWSDAIGNTTGVEDGNQNRSDWYWYSAYGSTWTYRQGVFTPHQFVGKQGYYDDGDSGMLLLGHRYYLPGLQRFLTQDPMGHEAGLNLYQYAHQNPLSNSDPSGLDDTPKPPPFPVPGAPGNSWKWVPNPNYDKKNPRSRPGKFVPKTPVKGTGGGQPSTSWDTDPSGRGQPHWDLDDGKGGRQRFDGAGKPITDAEAHGGAPMSPPSPATRSEFRHTLVHTGSAVARTAAGVGVAYGTWLVIKWTAAAFAAPETGGTSLVLAGATP